MKSQFSPPILLRYGLGIFAILALLVAGIWVRPGIAGAVTHFTAPDPVTAAWQKARAAGSYHFTSDVLQKSIPVASITNVGRSSRSDAFHLEGQNDLRAQKLELTLWNQGGSVLNAASGVSMRTEGGKTFTRRGNEAWQETDNQLDGIAPQGDFLGYLAAIRNVSSGVRETRNGISFTRYTFEIDGPAFANYMHKQMLAALRAKGELPPGVQLEPSAYYREMTGGGELWVGANGLPLRQTLDLHFPEQKEERVEAHITVDFSRYGVEQSGLLALLRSGQWRAASLVLPQRLPDLTGLWLALSMSAAAYVVLVYRRARVVQTALVSAVIFSQVASPLLSTFTQVKFFDAQSAKAAAQEERVAAAQEERKLSATINSAPEFDPHQNPLEFGDSTIQASLQAPAASPQSLTLQATDPGTDTDGDTLTDFTEVRIDTSEVFSDTDDDGLPDNLEVNGFAMGGQTWYTDPDATDSNRDGQADVVEWGLDSAGELRATPLNTDGDSLPDLFDPDNDEDGVPDRLDLAPFRQGGAAYSEANPLQLSIKNLTPDKPTFVEFQIRPQEPKNLWFAHNVLDWPQDSEGQVRDVDNKSYADVAGASLTEGAEANGDMKLVPMLEIRIPNSSANLPSQAELTPFNISVNDFTPDGATKVAYVPLAIVIDDQSGERVAFSGQMRYKPTGSWSTPHSVRLAWVVQALNDLPCDPKAADAAAQGCQSDGYIHNHPSVIQSYYENWTLTGLTVREDNGASMAIAYEDPAVDDDTKENTALWALTLVLDQHFLIGRDENNDGVRDLKLSDLGAHFDRDNNPSDAQRFSVPNILQVATNSYTSGDEATAATAMTETMKILDATFKPVVTADNSVKPLLLFAQENKVRAVGLDQVGAGDNYATQSGANLTLDFAPTAESALPVTVIAGLKWMAYCGANGASVAWRPCTPDEYAGEIEQRYAAASSEPDDGPYDVAGRMMLTLAYYFRLTVGYGVPVQEGTVVPSSRYSLEGESDTAARVRAALNSLTPVPLLAHQTFQRVILASHARTFKDKIKQTIAQLGTTYHDMKVKLANLEVNEAGQIVGDPKTIKLNEIDKLPIRMARLAALGIAGGALMAVFTGLSLSPDLNIPTRAVFGALGATIALVSTVILPVAFVVYIYKFTVETAVAGNTPKPKLSKLLATDLTIKLTGKIALGVGLALSGAVIWGFFIYAAAASGYAAASPELNKAFAEAVAASLVAVLLAVLSATLVGTIIVGIITVIDLIFTLICELGAPQLRNAPGLGGACFSLTTAATKVLAYFLYNYEPMIDTSRSDLMVTGALDVSLADPSKGYIAANTVTVTLPVTTTAVHKNPDPTVGIMINGYLYLYSPDNLRSSTFQYGLSQGAAASQPVDLNQMSSSWQGVSEDHKYVLTPMYKGVARTDPAPLGGLPLRQGINSTVPFSLTMNFAIPAYECWPMWIPGTPIVFPVCRTREYENTNTTPFTMIKYDVFPNTLAGFLALGAKSESGMGLSWDAAFPSLRDVDGDGLSGLLFNGLDPNDNAWDSDADGLSDRFELERRAASVAYSPVQRDTDSDGLTDGQEAQFGTDPAIADTDNDGLSDGVEVRHQVVDANGELTSAWAGGWQLTINSTPARTVWVSSDPFGKDGDLDGLSDQAEKELSANPDPALRLDDQGMPYHPNVPNTPPLAVFAESDTLGNYVRPGATFNYTTTVVAHVPVAPGVLDVTVPPVLGASPNPYALAFDPLTFSTAQTVTNESSFTVAGNASTQSLTLNSKVRTRLQSTGGSDWVVDPLALGAPLSGFSAPFTARSTGLAAARADRQDSYLLGALTSDSANDLTENSRGQVRGYNLTSGTGTVLENSAINNGANFWRGASPATLANNNLGATLVAWDHADRCNTLTLNYLQVIATADDHGTSGIEPFLTLVTNDLASSEQVWYWATGGGAADMNVGDQRGPDAYGFPMTFTICGQTRLEYYESDGPVNDPSQNQSLGSTTLAPQIPRDNKSLPSGGVHTVYVNLTVPLKDEFVVAGALLGADGAVKRNLTFPRPSVPTERKLQMRHPVVASNGNGFLVAYEVLAEDEFGFTSGLWYVLQAFDKDGNPIGNSAHSLSTTDLTQKRQLAKDLAWMGDRYRLAIQPLYGADPSVISFQDFASDAVQINGLRTEYNWPQKLDHVLKCRTTVFLSTWRVLR
jgi:hypothetical protein